jgi:hypothetical protein
LYQLNSIVFWNIIKTQLTLTCLIATAEEAEISGKAGVKEEAMKEEAKEEIVENAENVVYAANAETEETEETEETGVPTGEVKPPAIMTLSLLTLEANIN